MNNIEQQFVVPFDTHSDEWEHDQYKFPWSIKDQELVDIWTSKKSVLAHNYFNEIALQFNHNVKPFEFHEEHLRYDYLHFRRLIFSSPRVTTPFFVFRCSAHPGAFLDIPIGDLVIWNRFSSASLKIGGAQEYCRNSPTGTLFVIELPQNAALLRVRLFVEDEYDQGVEDDYVEYSNDDEEDDEMLQSQGLFSWSLQMDPDSEVILPDRAVMQLVSRYNSTNTEFPFIVVIRFIGVSLHGMDYSVKSSKIHWEELYVPLTRNILNANVHMSSTDAPPPKDEDEYWFLNEQ
jgi:hypothetical protein